MTRKPVIAVTTRLELETGRFYLGRDYSEALVAAGAAPLLVPLVPDRDFLSSVLDRCDGVLLPGSDTDVDPLRFGQEPRPGLKKVIPEKEETDFIVLEEATARNLSLLGICFGMQALNVFCGGSLFQDIEREVADCVRHEQGVPLARGSHTIDIEPGSLLADLAGDAPEAVVNSHHHQGVRDAGEGLRVTARTRDGIAECLEGEDPGRFVVGVQWHPELSWRTDALSRAIFERFVARCRAVNN